MKNLFNKLLNKFITWLGMRMMSEREKKLNKLLQLKEEILTEQFNHVKMSKIGEDETLKELIFIDKHGNKWYSLTNYLNVSMERFTNIQIAERYLQINLTKETLTEILVMMKQKFDDSQWADLGGLIGELIARSKFEAERETYIRYMSLVFLINDETLQFNNDLYNKKIQIIKDDLDLQGFFLDELGTRFQLFTTNSKQILDYFQKTDTMKMKLESLRKN